MLPTSKAMLCRADASARAMACLCSASAGPLDAKKKDPVLLERDLGYATKTPYPFLFVAHTLPSS